MWLKLVFAISYILCVVLFSRIIDVAVKSYDRSSLILLPTRIIVDPLSMSVKHLKSVLDSRGVSYSNVIEKRELHSMVVSSGEVTSEEVEESSRYHNRDLGREEVVESTKHLTSESHFFEVVEDTKDSAWIVLVVPFISGAAALSLISEEWKAIVKKASLFGIRTALFDCSSDESFCESRKWSSPRLLLALPKEEHSSKSDVVLKQYILSRRVSVSLIFKWIHAELSSRIKRLHNLDLEMKGKSQHSVVKPGVILITNMTSPPLFFSALAIKFTRRATFSIFSNEKKEDEIPKSFQKSISRPMYSILISDNSSYEFGKHEGETFNFRSMELVMKTLIPEMNDIFLLSLILVNIASFLDLFWIRCTKFWKHLMYWILRVIKANIILFLFWLFFMTISGLPSVKPFLSCCLNVTQYLSLSTIAHVLRHDALYYYKSHLLSSCFCFMASLVWFIRRRYFDQEDDFDDEQLFRDWTPLESTILNYILFRPIGMSNHSLVSNVNLEEGMEQLIERLAVPNLWLQDDFISNEYIKDLPFWLHSVSDDDEDDSEIDNSSSSQVVSECESIKDFVRHHQHASSQRDCSHNSALNDEQHPSCSVLDRKGPKMGLNTISKKKSSPHVSSKQPPSSSPVDSREVCPSLPPEFMLPCEECAICLESLRKNQRMCGLPCGHSYHESCILPWLFRDNHVCPTCRWPSNQRKQQQAFLN